MAEQFKSYRGSGDAYEALAKYKSPIDKDAEKRALAQAEEDERKRRMKENIAAGKNADGSDKSMLDGIKGALDNAEEFAEESNKAFLGNTIEGAASTVNWLTSLGNEEETERKNKEFRKKLGLRDANGLNALEAVDTSDLSDIKVRTEEEMLAEKEKNETDAFARAGKTAGDVQKIGVDAATLVIPGAAAEKALRGTRALAGLANKGKMGRVASEVASSVGGGIAATGVGAVVDPQQAIEDAQNGGLAGSTAIDAGLGLLGGVGSVVARARKASKAANEALEEGATVLGKTVDDLDDAQAMKILEDAKKSNPRLLLEEPGKDYYAPEINQIDDELAKIKNVDEDFYREKGFVTKDKAKLKELLDSHKPQYDEVSKEIQAADEEIKRLHLHAVGKEGHTYFRQTDRLNNALKKETDEILRMADEDGLPQEVVDDLLGDARSRYAPKFQALDSKYPDQAAEKPALDDAIKNVTMQKLDAQERLQKLADDDAATADNFEAVDPDALRDYTETLETRKTELNNKVRAAELRKVKRAADPEDYDEQAGDVLDKDVNPQNFDPEGNPIPEKVEPQLEELHNTRIQAHKAKVLKETPPTTGKPSPEEKAVVVDDLAENIEMPNGRRPFLMDAVVGTDDYLQYRGMGKTADKVEEAITAVHRQQYDDHQLFKSWKQSASDKSEDLFRAADGNEEAFNKLSDNGKQVIENWRAHAKAEAEALGLAEDQRISEYIPHIFDYKEGKFMPEGLARILKKNDKGNVNNKFMQKRTNAEGFKEDFWEAINAYSEQAARKKHIEPVTQDLMKIAESVDDKRFSSYLTKTADHLRGVKNNPIDEGFNNMVDGILGTSGGGTKAARVFKNLNVRAALWANPGSVINSLAQMANVGAEINPLRMTQGMAHASKMLGRLGTNTASKQDRVLWKEMIRSGVFEGATRNQADQIGGKLMQGADTVFFSGIQGADRMMRMTTYLGAYKAAVKAGKEGEEAYKAARRATSRANFNFDNLRVPPMFRSQVVRSMGSLVTFLPGQVLYTGRTAAGTLKGAKNVATGKGSKEDWDRIAKGLYFSMGVAGVSQLIGQVTGNEEVIPNLMNPSTWSTPATQFVFGSDTKGGLIDLVTPMNRPEGEYADKAMSFLTDTAPGSLVPLFGQGKKMLTGDDVASQGYSETDTGRIRYLADDEDDLQTRVFGQYSTDEGKEYVKNMFKEGGGTLSKRESDLIKEQSVNDRDRYYTFFRAAKAITGETEARAKIKKLMADGRPEAARRAVAEYNVNVEEKLRPYYEKYAELDEDLQEELNDNIRMKMPRD